MNMMISYQELVRTFPSGNICIIREKNKLVIVLYTLHDSVPKVIYKKLTHHYHYHKKKSRQNNLLKGLF